MSAKLPEPTPDQLNLNEIFSALSDPLRREVISRLALLEEGTERSCASFGFPVAKASLTHHFRVLREAGLISQFDYGNRRASVLRIQELSEKFPELLPLLVNNFRRQENKG
ncbi:helix-turn-helix transcriptional regulator [Enterobacter sp. Acro-832]|uniref:ArsR/SmtB family transcription factor n=1 Tax=Enterobacter sp. Acro-832 TaxID=2608348 RepID=UPI001423EDCE|nr:helix-turn-helix domain-containing protein [Enterobacter sp. Acro-832]NIG46441.1 helix-turn-helix transcriptional regulator [Enterobacter sp. Acro-832]